MKEKISLAVTIVVGLIIAFIVGWSIYTTYTDHEALTQVVGFINQSIAAAQKQQAPVSPAPATK